MFFDKSKGAFRVGASTNDSWDDTNVGAGSIALGDTSIAAGTNAMGIGSNNEVNSSSNNSIALGNFNGILTSTNSIALGDSNGINNANSAYAIGTLNAVYADQAVGIGFNSTTGSYAQVTLGTYNTVVTGNRSSFVSTDRLLVVGNGTSGGQRSDALVMLKNGNTTLNGQLTIDGDNQGSGASYTLPAQDGTANQVMTTDGAGNVTWIDYGLEAVSSPTFSSGWENYSVAHGNGFEDGRYYIDNGRVYLGGLIRKTAAITAGELMFNLPVGYRPVKQRIFVVSTEAGIIRIDVGANGNVVWGGGAYNGSQNWISLDGISFRID